MIPDHPCSCTGGRGTRATWRLALGAGIPALLLTAVGTVLALDVRRTPSLLAFGGSASDSDQDGLSDRQEQVLCTAPDVPDTDGDGFSDLDEVARQSDPCDEFSLPVPTSPKVGIVGRVVNGVLTTAIALYVEGESLADLRFQYGVVYHGSIIPVNLSLYQGSTFISVHPASNGVDRIVLIEAFLPDVLVHELGPLSFYAIHGGDGGSPEVSAAALDLMSHDGHTISVEEAPAIVQGGTGTILRPLESGNDIPGDWTGGQICWQLTTMVGVSGKSIVYEVEAAACEMLDTYCSPSDCAATVGTTIELVDPGSLIGG